MQHPSAADAAGTLESRVSQRLAACRDDEDKVRYILEAMPFIKEYSYTETVEQPAEATTTRCGSLDEYVKVTHKSNKNSVLKRYLFMVENMVDKNTLAAVHEKDRGPKTRNGGEADYYCDNCDSGGMEFHSRESLLVCPSCGACKTFAEMNKSNMTYEQQITQVKNTSFSYQRINHLCENLNSFHAKVRKKCLRHCICTIMARMSIQFWVMLFVALAFVGAIVALGVLYARESNKRKDCERAFGDLPDKLKNLLD